MTAGTQADVSARRPFCIDQLRIVAHLSNEELHYRNTAVKERFGFQSFHLLEEEFAVSVEPFYKFICHHQRQNPADVINFLLGDGKAPHVSSRDS